MDADVIAVQEADFRWRGRPAALCPDMIAERSGYKLVDAALNEESVGWHGNAVLVRRNQSVGSIDRISLPGFEPRGALRIDLDIDGDLTVVATHLGLTRFHRQKQLVKILANLKPNDCPTVIMGDFNEWSQRRGLDALRQDFLVHAPGKSFHASLPVAALDRLALSTDIELLDAGVVETRQSLRASDHLPIWGDVVVNRRNTGEA